MRVFKAIFLSLITTAAVFGQIEGNPENWCRNGFFPRESEEYKLAKIKAAKGERVYFYSDDENCPNGKNCRLKSYLISNNEVIVSRAFGNFACAWFQPARGSETVGWIPLENLEFTELNKNPAAADWFGEWRYYDNSISISRKKTSENFQIKGNAFWKGLGDNIHIGELDDAAKSSGNILKIGENETDQYACKVTMRLLGRFLIVADNMNCGGVNVTFSGVYQKKKLK